MKANLLTKTVISEARDLLENFDESGAMTIGFDKPKYTITSEQLQLLAQAQSLKNNYFLSMAF